MEKITVQTKVNKDANSTWTYWTEPEHITGWNFASPDWHCPRAINDVKPGGRFSWRMEAKDGSMGFDFCGSYLSVKHAQQITAKLDDGRHLEINFQNMAGETTVSQSFDPDDSIAPEQQQAGWQAILENFRKYTENN